MEMFFIPTSEAAKEKESVIAALKQAGLEPLPEADGKYWVVGFAGFRTFINFHENEGSLSFACLEASMAEQDLGHKAFCALEDLGWSSDEEAE